MRHFVQLKDDVVFAFHSSSVEVDIPGDNIIQVEEDGEKFLNKKYIDGSFIDAPIIKYAIIDPSNNNTVVDIRETVFSSEVFGPIITSDDVKILWTWNGEGFVSPVVIEPVTYIPQEPPLIIEGSSEPIAPSENTTPTE